VVLFSLLMSMQLITGMKLITECTNFYYCKETVAELQLSTTIADLLLLLFLGPLAESRKWKY